MMFVRADTIVSFALALSHITLKSCNILDKTYGSLAVIISDTYFVGDPEAFENARKCSHEITPSVRLCKLHNVKEQASGCALDFEMHG